MSAYVNEHPLRTSALSSKNDSAVLSGVSIVHFSSLSSSDETDDIIEVTGNYDVCKVSGPLILQLHVIVGQPSQAGLRILSSPTELQ